MNKMQLERRIGRNRIKFTDKINIVIALLKGDVKDYEVTGNLMLLIYFMHKYYISDTVYNKVIKLYMKYIDTNMAKEDLSNELEKLKGELK